MRQACIDMIDTLARGDPRVVFVGSDLRPGTLAGMKRDMPDRWLMEGVSEQGIIGLAAGLALEGYVPYVASLATFLTRRCFEQIAVDLCLHHLPVRLIGQGGGLAYAALGPTHMAIEDLALLRALPNMTILAPVDAEEMRRLMRRTLDWPGPIYIRLAKGGDPIVTRDSGDREIGKAVPLRRGRSVLLVATGVMSSRALQAADELMERDGIDAGVLHFHTIKPFDTTALHEAARGVDLLVTVEEHVRAGGLGSVVLEGLADADAPMPRVTRLGLPDTFISDYGSQDTQLERFGLQPAAIAAAVREARSGSHRRTVWAADGDTGREAGARLPAHGSSASARARKIFITGGPGSGKTTLSRRVAAALDTPVYELDGIYFDHWDRRGDRRASPDDAFDQAVAGIAATGAWVAEGLYLERVTALLRNADVIIWMDVPWRTALYRLVRRHLTRLITRDRRDVTLRALVAFSRRYYGDCGEIRTNRHGMPTTRTSALELLAPYRDKVIDGRVRRTDIEALVAGRNGS